MLRPWFLALAVILGGCRGPSEVAVSTGPAASPFTPYFGTVVARTTSIVPSDSWIERDGGTFWAAKAGANVLILMPSQATNDLRFGLVPDDPATVGAIRFAFDALPMSVNWLVIGETEVRIEIPAAQLSPGLHVLSLSTDGAVVPFRRLGARLGNETWEFTPGQRSRYEFIWRFLSLGVTPSPGIDTMGGILFDGPGSIRLEAGLPGKFSCRLLNSSAENATFQLLSENQKLEWTLSSGENREVEVDRSGMDGPVTLEVSGLSYGRFLWGAPFIAQGNASRPPIVLITLDTTRRDALGAYGAGTGTPNLDRFAEGATVFDNAVTVSPWTLPSHASMMTGLYPSKHGGGVEALQIPPRSTPVARLLSDEGYMTMGLAGGLLVGHGTGLGRGFLRYRSLDGIEVPGDVLTDAAVQLLSRFGGDPFFLFVNYFAPHFPHVPRREFSGALEARMARVPEDSVIKRIARGEPGSYDELFSGVEEVDSDTREVFRVGYEAEVATMDADVGRLLDALRDSGAFDRALIMIVGDHGELLGDRGRFGHAARLDPELIEIPFIIKWPGQTDGVRDARLVSVVDLFATILDVAGLDIPESDGVSLAGEPVEAHPWVVAEEHDRSFHPLYPAMKIADDAYEIRSGTLRQVFWNGGTTCQVPMGERSWQTVSCSSTEAAGGFRPPQFVVLGLSERPSEAAPLTPEQEEKLRALGYLR